MFEYQLFGLAFIWAAVYAFAFIYVLLIMNDPMLAWVLFVGDTVIIFAVYYFVKFYNKSAASEIINKLNLLYLKLINFNGDLPGDHARLHILAMNNITKKDIDANILDVKQNQTLVQYKTKRTVIGEELKIFENEVQKYVRNLKRTKAKDEVESVLLKDIQKEVRKGLDSHGDLKPPILEKLKDRKYTNLIDSNQFKENQFFDQAIEILSALEDSRNKDFADTINRLLVEEKHIISELILAHPTDPEIPVLRVITITRDVGLEKHLAKDKTPVILALKGQTMDAYEYELTLQTLMEGSGFVPYCVVKNSPYGYKHPKQLIENATSEALRGKPGKILEERLKAVAEAEDLEKVDTLDIKPLEKFVQLSDWFKLARQNQELQNIIYEFKIKEYNMEAEIDKRSIELSALAAGKDLFTPPKTGLNLDKNTTIFISAGLIVAAIVIMFIVGGLIY